MYNSYIRFNYKNIIPFNLKKKKLRIHANIIGSKPTNLYGFFISGEVKFWYYCFGINGLKKDNVFLIKNFLNKKLGVFFISNFNMVEGKWLFSKIYEQYYKNYAFLKKKKINILKIKLIISHNYNINNIFYIKYLNYIHVTNLIRMKYMYNYNILILKLNIFNNYNFFYKFKKLSLFNNVKNRITLYTYNHINKNKKFFWFWNFYEKKKLWKKKEKENQKNFGLIFKFKPYVMQKPNLFFTKKWYFIQNKKFLKKFYLIKNIINSMQFIKISKALNVFNIRNILFIFYRYYLHFNFIKLNTKNIIKLKKRIIINNISKKLKYDISKLKKKKKYLQYFKVKNIKLNKKINLIKKYKKRYFFKHFLILKKNIYKKMSFFIWKKNILLNKININNNFEIYNKFQSIWLKYIKIKNQNKLAKLFWLKKKDKNKFKKKYNFINIYLLWLYYNIQKKPLGYYNITEKPFFNNYNIIKKKKR